jgi:hypothetical protein
MPAIPSSSAENREADTACGSIAGRFVESLMLGGNAVQMDRASTTRCAPRCWEIPAFGRALAALARRHTSRRLETIAAAKNAKTPGEGHRT